MILLFPRLRSASIAFGEVLQQFTGLSSYRIAAIILVPAQLGLALAGWNPLIIAVRLVEGWFIYNLAGRWLYNACKSEPKTRGGVILREQQFLSGFGDGRVAAAGVTVLFLARSVICGEPAAYNVVALVATTLSCVGFYIASAPSLPPSEREVFLGRESEVAA